MTKIFSMGTVSGILFVLLLATLFTGAFNVQSATANTSSPGQTVQATGTDWWPMFHHDLSHTGYSTSTGPTTSKILWTYPTGDQVGSSPAVIGGMVYVGSDDNSTYCLNAATGKLVWSYKTGYWVFSSPAVVNGVIYVGSVDGKIYAFGSAPLVTSFSVSPNPFSPNNDGVKDNTTIKATFNVAVNWNLQIRSSSGATLRSWTGTGTSLSIVWDGKNSTGFRVPDGTYTVRLSGKDLLGVAFTTKSATVTVDTKRPTITAVSVYPSSFKPASAQTTRINYTLSESCYVTIKIYNSASALKRTLLNNVLQASGFHSLVWNGKDSSNLIVPPGTYTIKIYVVDKAGNKATSYPIIRTITVT